MTKVKICGITRAEDAELAVSLGAWAIGFILWPESKRYADPAVAGGISHALHRQVERVGVFVNQPLDEIAGLVDTLGLSYVQLHGDEGPSFCAAVAQRTGARVIKAMRIAHASDLRELDRFTPTCTCSTPRSRACAAAAGNPGTGAWPRSGARRSRSCSPAG